jgi:oxygen-independent coproporphyrinogen-3 oxidase
MTSLRTAKGISLNSLLTKFGEKMRDFCLKSAAPFLKNGTLEDKNVNLRLTEDGIFVSDGIMAELMWVD